MSEFERDITSHRQTTDDRAVDLQFVHQRRDIARHVIHRGDCPISFSLSLGFTTGSLSDKLKFVGLFTEAEQIRRDTAISARAQKLDLLPPHRPIEWEAVKKDNRLAAAAIVVGDLNAS